MEEIQNKRIILVALLTLLVVAFSSLCSLSPTLAWDINVLSNVKIMYYTGGNVSVSHNFYIGNKLVIGFSHVEGGNVGTGDNLIVSLSSPTYGLFPFAVITTNPDAVSNEQTVWSGTPIYINKAGKELNNIKLVSDAELQVVRHGNSITVDFNPASTLTLKFPALPSWPTPPTTLPLVLPAFHLELNKEGGSIHEITATTLTSTTLALSGYTLENDRMGFNAQSFFICTAWADPAATDSFITMHGIETATPP